MTFWRRKPLPELTNAAYQRWLRAQRPPFQWFLERTEIEQEHLAQMGDEHAQDFALAVGYAVRDPEVAEAGVAAAQGDMAGEEALARRLAATFAQRIQQQRPAAPPPTTMSGLGQRKEAAQAAKAAQGPRLFGRPPDAKEAAP